VPLYTYNAIVPVGFNLEADNIRGWNDVSSLSFIPSESQIPYIKVLTNKKGCKCW